MNDIKLWFRSFLEGFKSRVQQYAGIRSTSKSEFGINYLNKISIPFTIPFQFQFHTYCLISTSFSAILLFLLLYYSF